MKTHKNLTTKERLRFDIANGIQFDCQLLLADVNRIISNVEHLQTLNNVYDIIENTICSLHSLTTNDTNHESDN